MGGTKLRLDNGCIVGLVADSVEQVQMSDYDTHHMTRVNNDDPFSSTSTSHFVAAANRLLYNHARYQHRIGLNYLLKL